MKAAILSCTHSNLEALKAVHTDIKIQGVDQIINLGDTIGYGRDTVECLDWAVQYCGINLQGNHEKAVLDVWDAPGVSLGGLYGHTGSGAVQGAYWALRNILGDRTPLEQRLEDTQRYTARLIERAKSSKSKDKKIGDGKARIERMRSWPVEWIVQIPEEGINFGVVHDNPVEPGKHKYVLDPSNPLYGKTSNRYSPREVFDIWDVRPDVSLWFYGHSHFAGIHQVYGKNPLKGHPKPCRVLVGVGSVGIPRSGSDATYALLTVDKGKWSVRIRRVSGIDWQRVGKQWQAANLKNKFAKMELD